MLSVVFIDLLWWISIMIHVSYIHIHSFTKCLNNFYYVFRVASGYSSRLDVLVGSFDPMEFYDRIVLPRPDKQINVRIWQDKKKRPYHFNPQFKCCIESFTMALIRWHSFCVGKCRYISKHDSHVSRTKMK